MNKRRLLLAGTGLALLLLVADGALSIAGSADAGQNFIAGNHPVMRYGGPLEKTLRLVPPLHGAIRWLRDRG